jgi:invasion protein IalB
MSKLVAIAAEATIATRVLTAFARSIDTPKCRLEACLPNGCVAEVVMDDNLLKQLRNGQTATFIIFQTPEEGIGFPMSLKGFGEGFDKLS